MTGGAINCPPLLSFQIRTHNVGSVDVKVKISETFFPLVGTLLFLFVLLPIFIVWIPRQIIASPEHMYPFDMGDAPIPWFGSHSHRHPFVPLVCHQLRICRKRNPHPFYTYEEADRDGTLSMGSKPHVYCRCSCAGRGGPCCFNPSAFSFTAWFCLGFSMFRFSLRKAYWPINLDLHTICTENTCHGGFRDSNPLI